MTLPSFSVVATAMRIADWFYPLRCSFPDMVRNVFRNRNVILRIAQSTTPSIGRVFITAEMVGAPNGIGYVLTVGRSTRQAKVEPVAMFVAGCHFILNADNHELSSTLCARSLIWEHRLEMLELDQLLRQATMKLSRPSICHIHKCIEILLEKFERIGL